MVERRRASRYPVSDVRGTLVLTASAKILNMSLTGMAIESSANMRVGRSYRLRLTHGEVAGPDLSGTVVWCHLKTARPVDTGGTTPVYEAGMQFDCMLTGTAGELIAFLRATAILTMQQRLMGRFRVNLEETVNLNAECEFVVRTLSASGMLIETDVAPEPGALFTLRLQLADATLSVCCRVAFVRDVGEQDKRRITSVGVEFVEMSAADRDRLDAFIASQIAPE
jgi:Tfp pilus assembly protein PilZ